MSFTRRSVTGVFPQRRSRRTLNQTGRLLLATFLALSLCNEAYAQDKQAALRALGKFATEVAAKLAVDITKDEIKRWMMSSTPSSGLPAGAGSGTTGTLGSTTIGGQAPGSALARATPVWVPRQKTQQLGYQFSLTWTDPRDARVSYRGHLQMWGAVGYFNVVEIFDQAPVSPIIQQAVVAEAAPNGRDVILRGYYPRVAGTSSLMPNYAPDAFRLTQNSFGNWTIADTCGANYVCAPVYVVDSSVQMQ